MKDYLSMRCLLKYLMLSISLIVIIFVMQKSYELYLSAEHSAVKSCVLSVTETLRIKLKDKEIKKIISPNREWKVLNPNEQNFLFNSVTDKKRLDCKRFSYFTNGKTQKGDDLRILVREIDGEVEVVIEGFE